MKNPLKHIKSPSNIIIYVYTHYISSNHKNKSRTIPMTCAPRSLLKFARHGDEKDLGSMDFYLGKKQETHMENL